MCSLRWRDRLLQSVIPTPQRTLAWWRTAEGGGWSTLRSLSTATPHNQVLPVPLLRYPHLPGYHRRHSLHITAEFDRVWSLGCLPTDIRLNYIVRGLILSSRMEFEVVYLQGWNFVWTAFSTHPCGDLSSYYHWSRILAVSVMLHSDFL
jgi:hypothetical protein